MCASVLVLLAQVVVTSRADAAFDASAAAAPVEKFALSDEAYAARPNRFKRPAKKKAPAATDDTGAEAAAALLAKDAVGQRVKVLRSGAAGTLRFVGGSGGGELGAAAEKLPAGWWCGVELDGDAGKHDGVVGGHRLFGCEAGNSGAMVRPDGVELLTEEGAAAAADDDDPDEM